MTKRPLLRVSLMLLTLGTAAHAQDATQVGGAWAGGDVDPPHASAYPYPAATPLPSEDDDRWDAIDLFDHELQVTPSISYRRSNREFGQFGPIASSGANTAPAAMPVNGGAALPYHFNSKTSLGVSPSLTGSFQVAPEVLIFSSLSKSFKLPGNPEYFNQGHAASMAGSVGTTVSLAPLKVRPESSVNLDMGALYKSGLFRASASAFLVKFRDRIASSFEPATAAAPSFNVGNSTVKGLDIEVGTLPVLGFSAYASATYAKRYPDHAMPLPGNALSALGDAGRLAAPFPVAGFLFPESPKRLAAMALQYNSGSLLVNLAGKFTGRRNITVVGDQSLAGFTTFDLNVALRLPADRLLKNPTLRFDVSNFTDKRFPLTQLPSLYGGVPRYTSITLQSDF